MSHLPLVNLAYDNFPICLTREGRGQSTRDPWVHFVQVRSQDFTVTAAARVIARDAHSGTEGSSHRHMLVHNFCVRCRLFLLLLLKPSLHIFLVRDSQLRAWQHQLTPRRLAAHASCQHLQMPSQKPLAAYTGCPLLSEMWRTATLPNAPVSADTHRSRLQPRHSVHTVYSNLRRLLPERLQHAYAALAPQFQNKRPNMIWEVTKVSASIKMMQQFHHVDGQRPPTDTDSLKSNSSLPAVFAISCIIETFW